MPPGAVAAGSGGAGRAGGGGGERALGSVPDVGART
jgi:hypothetical protein